MATSFNFDGNIVKIPGAYSNVKSGIKNPSQALPYGKVLVIDTGSGAGYGGGAGIDGEISSGNQAIYEFDNVKDFRDFTKGGLWYLLADPLFRPAGLASQGISSITYVKAATTIAAEISLSFTGDGDGSESVVNGGDIVIWVTDEGLVGNGALNTASELSRGFAVKLEAGKIDTTKFVLKFYRGGFTGLDQNSLPYDGVLEVNSKPVLLETSPEFTDLQDIVDWMAIDATFLKYFKLKSATLNGDGTVDEYDVINNPGYILAAGGTESYAGTANLESVLEAVQDLDVSFVLCDKYATNSQHANNIRIVEWATDESKYKPEVYIGAGNDENTFSTSLTDAAYYDNDAVTLVHGGVKKISQLGLRLYDSIYGAALVLGREAGLAPQIPITFKNLKIDGVRHSLNDRQTTQALDKGVVVFRFQDGTFDIVKGINTLQQNTFLVNENGTTHSKQIKRIARQLNKEIVLNARRQLLKDPSGVNVNTLTKEDLKSWLIAFLRTKQARPGSDNLIINFYDISVERVGDAYQVSYKFQPNTEVSFLFMVGLMVDI